MARIRSNCTITGSAGVTAHLIDAMGGGLCKIHGAYYGHGKYGLKNCPYCDIDAKYQITENLFCLSPYLAYGTVFPAIRIHTFCWIWIVIMTYAFAGEGHEIFLNPLQKNKYSTVVLYLIAE